MKCYLVSLGCAKNQVDSERILGFLNKNGVFYTTDLNEANIVLINTCGFIQSAKEESINTILDICEKKPKESKVVVCGCLSQRYKDELKVLIPEVDLFIKIDEYDKFLEILNTIVKIDYKKDGINNKDKIVSTDNYYRYIKISDGCLNRCAFCAIPNIRGNLVSRSIEDIYDEVKKDVLDGAKEINLISQDTTRYGYDLYKKISLIDLLKKLVSIEGDFNIRLLYLYPTLVTDELIDFIKENKKIYPYFDIPIQHSEDKMLKLMNRNCTKEQMLNLFNKIKAKIDNAIIRTTYIVGFPNEQEEDFNNLLEFTKEMKFDRLGCFTYSKEEGTSSYKMKDDVLKKEKNRRLKLIMQEQEKISKENNKKYLGLEIELLITGYDEDEMAYTARNYMYAPDDVDGQIIFYSKQILNKGDKTKGYVIDYDSYSLICSDEKN